MNNLPHRFVAAQTIGGRERQADDFAVVDVGDRKSERLVLVVADGMGGHAKAADAARIAVSRFCDSITTGKDPLPSRLGPALESANHELALAALRDPTFKGAGCTLVAAAIEDNALSWISVGDSSLYLFRHGAVRLLNTKHVEPVGPGSRPERSAILRLHSALTGRDLRLIDASKNPVALITDDVIIVASDGLDCIGDRKIASILRRSAARSPTATVDLLLNAVRSRPIVEQDNTTIIFYRHPGTELNGRSREVATYINPKWKLVVAAVLAVTLLLAIMQRLLK